MWLYMAVRGRLRAKNGYHGKYGKLDHHHHRHYRHHHHQHHHYTHHHFKVQILKSLDLDKMPVFVFRYQMMVIMVLKLEIGSNKRERLSGQEQSGLIHCVFHFNKSRLFLEFPIWLREVIAGLLTVCRQIIFVATQC